MTIIFKAVRISATAQFSFNLNEIKNWILKLT